MRESPGRWLYALALGAAAIPLAILGTLGYRQIELEAELATRLQDEREAAVLERAERVLSRWLEREERAMLGDPAAPGESEERLLAYAACGEGLAAAAELPCARMPGDVRDRPQPFYRPRTELDPDAAPEPPPERLLADLAAPDLAVRADAEAKLRAAAARWIADGGLHPAQLRRAAEAVAAGPESLALLAVRLRVFAEARARLVVRAGLLDDAIVDPLVAGHPEGTVRRRVISHDRLGVRAADLHAALRAPGGDLGYSVDGKVLQDLLDRELPEAGRTLALTAGDAPIWPSTARPAAGSTRSLAGIAEGLSARYADRETRALADSARKQRRVFVGFALLLAAVAGVGAFATARAGARALELARLQRDFVSTVSHELKTPLSMVRLYADTLLLDRARDDEERRRFLQVIAREGERLSRLIEQMLDFARVELGTKLYEIRAGDLGALVRRTCEEYGAQVAAEGFALSVDVGEGLGAVPHDAAALQQALLGLLGNAVKYTDAKDPEARRIDVRAKAEGKQAVIEVQDRGIGVPAGERRRIFERFYRGRDPAVRERKGTGLGLAFVDHTIRAHGGEVTVFSRPGRGSIFSLHLPLTPR